MMPFSLILFVSPLAEQGKSDDTVFTHTICKPSGPYGARGMTPFLLILGKGMTPFSLTLFVRRLAQTGETG